MNQSIRTLDNPEFLDLEPLDINPLMSKCTIKVLYTGNNRNHSSISKDVATEMAKTLRGSPIVGVFKEEKEDFRDHGEKVIFDGDGIKFECETKPYGFVSPDAEVWFQTYDEEDVFGNPIKREYLMTNGYLWTGQFEEAKLALEGRPQSMELDEETLDGNWSKDMNSNTEFFIINDAIFSKLCILGEDIEPCFEGASIKASYTKVDDSFKQTLFTMMQDLKFALQGGQEMNEDLETVVTPEVDNSIEEPSIEEVEEITEDVIEIQADESVEAEFAKAEDEKDKEEKPEEADDKAEEKADDESDDTKPQDEEDKNKYELLQQENEALKEKINQLEEQVANFNEYKLGIERKEKQILIDSFNTLDADDKKDVVENIDKYSLERIEEKLCVVCKRKGVNFSKVDIEEEVEEPTPITTFNIEDTVNTMPAWLAAVEANSKE